MDRASLQHEVRELLTRAGFLLSESYEMRLAGFDLVARREDTLLIIKVLTNVDSISESVARGLEKLTFLLKATPLIIGEKNGLNPLEDNVAYDRFGIRVITLPTLRSHLLDDSPIWAYAAPGGFYVNLDSNRLRRLRQEKNISLGEFARSVRVSRRTVQMYEDGMSARVDIATRIEELLEAPVTTPIDLLHIETRTETLEFSHPPQELDHLKKFQREVFSLLDKAGYQIIPMDRCPFEALSKEREHIMLTCIQEYDKRLRRKAEILHSLSKITKKQAVVFLDKEFDRQNLAGTPIILKRELKKLCGPEEIDRLINERSEDD
jgi:putative transcriptional regulator